MQIKIKKRTPYRRDIEREIKIGEIHDITEIRPKNGNLQSKAYFFMVDGRERIVLDSDCVVI
jgi:hypothetical protein